MDIVNITDIVNSDLRQNLKRILMPAESASLETFQLACGIYLAELHVLDRSNFRHLHFVNKCFNFSVSNGCVEISKLGFQISDW